MTNNKNIKAIFQVLMCLWALYSIIMLEGVPANFNQGMFNATVMLIALYKYTNS